MVECCMPYKIPVSELSTELESVGFDVLRYINTQTLYKLHNVLVVREGFLEKIKCIDKAILPTDKFQIIAVGNESKDISSEVTQDNLIISLIPEYVWELHDNYEPFKAKKGDNYLDVVPKSKKFSEMDMLWMCIELSYRFGVKFMFYNTSEDNSFTVLLDRDFKNDKSVVSILKSHIPEIEKIYKVSIHITERYMPRRDIEFEE